MTALTVRRLLVDLETPVPRHWNGGDAFRTAFFNALSFSFPAGEQFFIDSMRRALSDAPAELQARFDDEVRGFIGQEATHRRIHQRFNLFSSVSPSGRWSAARLVIPYKPASAPRCIAAWPASAGLCPTAARLSEYGPGPHAHWQ